ncbi:MAG: ATP-binding protein [Rhodocyclaceae bacterium]|nr:MAG: ATP-binding protein [Rhodocyclaceae bacterium]
MPDVILIEGPVGAGKSTFAQALAQERQGVHIALDQWFAILFSPDRPTTDVVPWYMEHKERLLHLIWRHSQHVLASGKDVILELGLIQKPGRQAFCQSVQDAGFDPKVFVLDAPRDVRRLRVQRRNTEQGATFAMVVPEAVFEMASDLWEPPDDIECELYPVVFVPKV